MCKTTEKRATRTQGMNWIRKEKRLAIYLRDGLACVYCGSSVENGAQLSLDHLTPYSLGGSNDAANLVTCCSKCNSSRGNRDYKVFAGKVAEYVNHGVTKSMIVKFIQKTVKKSLDVAGAKNLIDARGGWSNLFTN